MEQALWLDGVTAGYVDHDVVHNVSLSVGQGESVGILGPNGAGKTTLIGAISGIVKLSGGSISFLDQDITRMSAPDRARLGICHVPEGRQLFGGMSVEENLLVGGFGRGNTEALRRKMDDVLSLFPDVAARLKIAAGALSGGQQQMVAIARGLMGSPRLLMLDEPSMGLAPAIRESLYSRLPEVLAATNAAMLLAEQNLSLAQHVCRQLCFLANGSLVSRTESDKVTKEIVTAMYFGNKVGS